MIYAHFYKPKGQLFNDDGVVIGENYGVTNWDMIGFVLFSIVTYFLFGLIRNSLDSGLMPGYALDIFAINLFSQFLLSFTRYGWYIYMLVPGYISYKLAGYAWGYISRVNTQKEATPEEIDPKDAKKQAKMERKEAKGQRVKFVRK